VKLWFGSSVEGSGFYYDWFQLGTVNITGKESKITYNVSYVSADYTVANENWALTTVDAKGFIQENGQLTLQTGEYDAAAYGAWLTYKVDVKEGAVIDELKLACVGNRLGSFGKAVGATANTVSFKPYISSSSTFEEPIEEIILPELSECYNLDYDFTPYLQEDVSTYYVKLWFGSSVEGSGFYYDWFQLGTVNITGKESGSKVQGPTIIDASASSVVIENETFAETGFEIKPIPTVTFENVVLEDLVDYYVTYENNIEPGTAKINITYIGDYTGKTVKTFTITAVEINYNDEDYAQRNYVPNQYDFIDYWGGIGDIEPEYGDGVTTFAHVSGIVPLQGTDVRFTSSISLLSKLQDEVDGWVTISLSSRPGVEGVDKSYPYYGGNESGYFLHITNYSTEENPNVVEVQLVKSVNGETTMVDKFMVNNLVTNTGVLKNDDIIFDFNLHKNEDGTWTLSFTNKKTSEVIVSKTYNYLNERLFINSNGQTYFSTAIYEGNGCDGNHWEHRGIKLYDMAAFTLDSSNVNIELSQYEYVYENGKPCKPDVLVKLDGDELQKDVDYYFEYQNNKEVGTAKVVVYFIGQYSGNDNQVVEFIIKEKENNNEQPSEEPSVQPSEEPSEQPSNQPSDTTSSSNEDKPASKGCKGSTSASFIIVSILGVLLSKKRKNI
ncbi:MAG: PT domain-containing protein, partial [Erysipelotrichaceae bacterium]|nr:PT domain-containing protein [Erysipelotrichaceae bacterium]